MTPPLRVNRVGGWARDLVQILWGDVHIDPDRFADLDARVLREVQFPCVILAEYDWGVAAIDCNDSDAYELDDPRIAIYFKLQYNRQHRYRQRPVYPFTFIPHTLEFAANLDAYRAQYARSLKLHSAWGRFSAVSLDRYHIAHEMGRLGLPGGSYVTTAEGYEDHYLDPVKPRQWMPFNEYMESLCQSMAVIDARGFGDLTHRAVECLAIGVPLIRPRFDTVTARPLVAGVHYLDCGHRGEHLRECIAAAQDQHVRAALVASGRAWFENNCTPESMRALFGATVERHRSPGPAAVVTEPAPRALGNPPLHLLVGLYRDPDDRRMQELAETFRFNVENNDIASLHVFWEDGLSAAEAIALVPSLEHPKVSVTWLRRRALFSDLFRYANQQPPQTRFIIANNDIFFGGLDRLRGYDLSRRLLCLTRWDVTPYSVPRYMGMDSSQDAWIFETPIDIDVPFPLGFWGCDGRINKEATLAGLLVSNPSFEIFAYHHHASGVKHYDSMVQCVPDGIGVHPSRLVWPALVSPDRPGPTAGVVFHERHGHRVHRLVDGVSSHSVQHRPVTRVPPQLYGLLFGQVSSWESTPMTIRCTAQGTLYMLVSRHWSACLSAGLKSSGAGRSTIADVETVPEAYEVWTIELRVGDNLTVPDQVILVADPLEPAGLETQVPARPERAILEVEPAHIELAPYPFPEGAAIPQLTPWQEYPWYGDGYLAAEVLRLQAAHRVTSAIETGTGLGSTALWLADHFAHVHTFETHGQCWGRARARFAHRRAITISLMNGVDGLSWVLASTGGHSIPFIFLDAQSAGQRPLLDELDVLARSGVRPCLVMYDFQVPESNIGFGCLPDGRPLNLALVEDRITAIYGQGRWRERYPSNVEGANRGWISIEPR